MTIFMKAGNILGGGKAKEHEGWIRVLSCKCDIEFPAEDIPEGKPLKPPKPKIKPLTLVKNAGGSSPALLDWLVKSRREDGKESEYSIPVVLIDACKETGERYQRYKLETVRLMDYTMGFEEESGDSKVNLTLKFDKITVEKITYDQRGKELDRKRESVAKLISSRQGSKE